MSRNITKNVLVIILLCVAYHTQAQQWLGRTTGNYSGTYGIYNNASSISDSKYKYYFNFWGRGANFYNNFLTYNAPIKINHWANNNYDQQYQNSTGKVDMRKDWLLENLDGKDKQLSFNQDIWGPAFMFPLGGQWNMSVNTRQRSGMQMYGISEEVARMAHNGLDSSGGIYSGNNPLSRNTSYHNNAFAANMQSYQEMSLTLGGVISQTRHHQFNFGVTVKFLRGLGASYIKGDNFNLTATGNNSAMINGDLEYAYTDQKSTVTPFNKPYGLFSLKSKGAGGGVDFGFNYTYTSDRLKYKSGCEQNDKRSDYDFKLAMALNDLGGIRYNKNSNLYSYNSTTNTSITAPSSILDAFGSPNQNGFDTIGQKIFSQIGSNSSNGFNTSLPLSFNLQADFRLSKHLYTSVYWNQNLKGLNSTGLRSTSMLSVIPRIESRVFELSIPLTLSENYKNFYVGAYTRIGPVFFGSDNLGGLLKVAGGGDFKGADIYGGVTFGIGHCHKWWYNDNQVDPVYMNPVDTEKLVEKDTVRTIKHDTVRITKKDTVYIDKKTREVIKPDTVIIEKIVKTKDPEKDKQIVALKKQVQVLNTEKARQDTALLACKKCTENQVRNEAEIRKLKNDILYANRRIKEMEAEIIGLKSKNPTEPVKGNDAEKLARAQRQLDSINVVVIVLRDELENCKKNALLNNTELVKKAEAGKNKAENDARLLKKRNDSLLQVLVTKTAELDNYKKNSTQNNADVVKKAVADKAKAENDARVARRQADSLTQILIAKKAELDNCKKNSTLNSTELVKKAEADKEKAENDAKVARRQADSLAQILVAKNVELENCKKNAAQYDAEVIKNKKATEENNLLKSEISEMSKNIAKLNSKNYALTYKVDSLINELKKCGKTGNSDDAELLKKCKEANVELNAEVLRLKTIVEARDNSLDSMKNVAKNLEKKQVELNAQITRLNTELADLKTKAGSANCDELQKQLDEKNAEINKLKTDAVVLQNKINTLNKQLSEQREEYNFMVKQNQRCNQKLDSCLKGLNHTEPLDNKEPDNKGGEIDPDSGSDEVHSSAQKLGKALKIGGEIINIIQNTSNTNGSSTQPSSGTTEPTGNGTNSRPSETTSGTKNTGSGSSNDRNSSGSNTATKRR